MPLEHLDAWQSRVFGLSLPLQTERGPKRITTRGCLKITHTIIPSLGLGGSRLGVPNLPEPTMEDIYLILGDGSTIYLRGLLWSKGVRCSYRSNLEESITCMFSSEFVEDAAKILLAPIVRRLDFTRRCIRMLQRYPEGVLGWVGGDDMKPFRVLVYEMFLEGCAND